jgi:hypothetical protein
VGEVSGRTLLVTAAAAGLALTAAGCGGGSNPPSVASVKTTRTTNASSPAASTGAAATTSYVAFANCMTSHGVPTTAQPNGGLQISGGDPSSPTFQQAQKACQALMPSGGSSRPPVTAAQKRTLLAFAACMRKHGLPAWPDPTFPPGGGIMGGGGSGYSKNSPGVRQAAAVCNKAMGQGEPPWGADGR